MKTKIIPILIANLFALPAAFAQEADAFRLNGEVGVGVRSTSINATDKSKAEEYRDLDSGLLGTFNIKGRGRGYYLDAYGENIGRDDQNLEARGGQYGVFKYKLFEDKIIHNWAYGALTPYSGVGSTSWTYPGAAGALPPNSTNSGAWNAADLRKKRENIGGMLEYSNNSPWYIRGEANEVRDKGLKLSSAANGTSPGNGFIDIFEPLSTKTLNTSVEGGYSSKAGQLSVSLLHSKFTNDNDIFNWRNPFFGGLVGVQDTATRAADSNYTKFGLNGAWKQLPMSSTLAGRYTFSKTTNSIPIATTALGRNAAAPVVDGLKATNPSAANYVGNLAHTTASMSLQSHPTRQLDSRIYWNYFKKENRSTEITFAPVAAGIASNNTANTGLGCPVYPPNTVAPFNVPTSYNCEMERLNYKKSNLGIDLGWRFNPQNRVVLGWDYLNVDRNRADYNNTKDKKYSIEWRNTSFDFLSSRAKYQRLDRDSRFLEGNSGVNANDSNFLLRFVGRFDAANVKQDLFKLGLDANPAPLWDLGLEAIYKENKYKNLTLGRTKDKREELYASVAYGDMNKFRVLAFADVEWVRYDSFHRNISTVSSGAGAAPNNAPVGWCTTVAAGVNCFDPSTPDNASNYNWGATNKDKNQSVGLGLDWVPMERLKVKSSLSWTKTNGSVDFTVPGSLVQVPIGNSDDTKKTAFNLRGTYTVNKQWDVTAAYAYERYTFSDIAYDGYTRLIPTTAATSATSYLSGVNAFTNYKVNSIYLIGTYKF